MTTRLKLSTRRGSDGTPVVTASARSTEQRRQLPRRTRPGRPGRGRLVVDLTAVQYLDSAGLTVLFAHLSRIQLIASPLLAPVLTISGLADITSVREPGDQDGGA